MKYSDTYKRQAIAKFDKAIASGASVAQAAQAAGHASTIVHQWRDDLAHAETADERHVAKRRACLRCGRGFRSSWAGHRVCERCKGSAAALDGLPDSWGATATVGVGDR